MWDNQHPAIKLVPVELGKPSPGFCRKKIPGALKIGTWYYGIQPIMDADEFCGEYKEDQDGLSE